MASKHIITKPSTARSRGENCIGAKVSTLASEGSLHKGTKPLEKGGFQHTCGALPNKETYPKHDRAPFLRGFQDISWDTLACGQWAPVTPELWKVRLIFQEC